MSDISAVISSLQSLRGDMWQARPDTLEAIGFLEHALGDLSGFEDQHARDAEVEVRAAIAAIREAYGTWMDQYVRRSDDLAQHLAS